MSRILVVGGGGREHALCWRIRHDRPDVDPYVAPGNGGTGALATAVPINATDIEGIVDWCHEHEPDLVVVGPDDPLAAGIVDALTAAGIRAFGPTAAAVRIEVCRGGREPRCQRAGEGRAAGGRGVHEHRAGGGGLRVVRGRVLAARRLL